MKELDKLSKLAKEIRPVAKNVWINLYGHEFVIEHRADEYYGAPLFDVIANGEKDRPELVRVGTEHNLAEYIRKYTNSAPEDDAQIMTDLNDTVGQKLAVLRGKPMVIVGKYFETKVRFMPGGLKAHILMTVTENIVDPNEEIFQMIEDNLTAADVLLPEHGNTCSVVIERPSFIVGDPVAWIDSLIKTIESDLGAHFDTAHLLD